MSVLSAIQNLKNEMERAGIVQEQGLGDDLFHFASTLTPVVNVDLFVVNKNGQILFSWREDDYDKSGWHVPGSCIRFQETLAEAIQRCAEAELGERVRFINDPVKVYEFHWNAKRSNLSDQRERAHFVTLVFGCALPDDYEIEIINRNRKAGEPGYLKWFDHFPEDIVPIQKKYLVDWVGIKERIAEELGHVEQ